MWACGSFCVRRVFPRCTEFRTFRYETITHSWWLAIDASQFLSSEPTFAFYLMQFDAGEKSLTSLLKNLIGWWADHWSVLALAEMIHSEITSLLQSLSGLLRQDQCNTFFMWRIVTYQTRIRVCIFSCQGDLPGFCPSYFANAQDSKIQPPHFLEESAQSITFDLPHSRLALCHKWAKAFSG